MAVHGTHTVVQDDRNERVLIYVNGKLFPRAAQNKVRVTQIHRATHHCIFAQKTPCRVRFLVYLAKGKDSNAT